MLCAMRQMSKGVPSRLLVVMLACWVLVGCSFRDPCVTSGEERVDDAVPPLRFDGIYQSDKFNNYYWKYLRFHPDGKVMAVSARYRAGSLMKKLNDESAGVGVGVWTQNGQSISFTCVHSNGEVKHEGEIQSDHLLMTSHSLINGQRSSTVYRFVEMELPE